MAVGVDEVDHLVVGLAEEESVTKGPDPLGHLVDRGCGEHQEPEPDHQHHQGNGEPHRESRHQRCCHHEADETSGRPHGLGSVDRLRGS